MSVDGDLGSGLLLPSSRDQVAALGRLYGRYLAATARRLVTVAGALPPALRPAAQRATTSLFRNAARDPGALAACVASPTVGTPIHCLPLRGGLGPLGARIDEAAAGIWPHLLLEAAARGLLTDEVPWPAPRPLRSPTLGLSITPPPGTVRLRFAKHALVAEAADGGERRLELAPPDLDPAGFTVERSYLPIGQLTRLALGDDNPIARFEAHPDKRGNALDLGGRAPGEWQARLGGALDLLTATLPLLEGELRLLLHQVIPVGWDGERHLSASYREAIGTVYLSLHPDELTLAEALLHEHQHNKLNLASHLGELLENPFFPLYPSPVRPDPRPLWGILLAVHAFLPVAAFYRRLRDGGHPRTLGRDFPQRLRAVDSKNQEGLGMLRAHGRFTAAGRRLMAELLALGEAHLAERRRDGETALPAAAHDGW